MVTWRHTSPLYSSEHTHPHSITAKQIFERDITQISQCIIKPTCPPTSLKREKTDGCLWGRHFQQPTHERLRKYDFGSHCDNLLQSVPVNIVHYASFILRSFQHESWHFRNRISVNRIRVADFLFVWKSDFKGIRGLTEWEEVIGKRAGSRVLFLNSLLLSLFCLFFAFAFWIPINWRLCLWERHL